MGLGNNRDYKTRNRSTRRNLAVVEIRAKELEAIGLSKLLANTTAMNELLDGKLNKQLKAWVDPILAHGRLMRFKNSLDIGELYVTITHDAPGWPGWTWAVEGWEDGAVRAFDLTSYKTQKALIAALDASTYKSFKRFRKQ